MRQDPMSTRYELQVGQGLRNFAVAYTWATVTVKAEKLNRAIRTHEVAQHLGWPRPLTAALLRQAQTMRMVEWAAPGWLPGDVDPLGAVGRYERLAAADDDAYAGLEPRGNPTMAKTGKVRRRRVPLNVTLPPALVARVSERAKRQGMSVSRLIERLAADYIAEPMVWSEADLQRYGVTVANPEPEGQA